MIQICGFGRVFLIVFVVVFVFRELEMRDVSNRTNARVAQYSQASLGFCIFVAALQLWYLRRYFQKKKLI